MNGPPIDPQGYRLPPTVVDFLTAKGIDLAGLLDRVAASQPLCPMLEPERCMRLAETYAADSRKAWNVAATICEALRSYRPPQPKRKGEAR
jgi:hypothetical protein